MYLKSNLHALKILSIVIFSFGIHQLFAQDVSVKIHYLGHSAFVLEFDNGVTVVSDYGHYNAWAQWGWDSPIHAIGELVPDIMTYSHHHEDHYDSTRIPIGVKNILSGMDSLDYKGISIKPIRTCEEDYSVESNTSYLFSYKKLRILHLGDAQAQIINIKINTVQKHILEIIPDSLDMLFMTIQGKTKFIPKAEEFVRLLAPKRIIPIHHWSEEYLKNFLKYLEMKNASGGNYQITKSDSSDYFLSAEKAVSPTKVIVLKRSPYNAHKFK